eukprot:scaffold40640_cov40-Phaeocystis_antarctica.AAC.1
MPPPCSSAGWRATPHQRRCPCRGGVARARSQECGCAAGCSWWQVNQARCFGLLLLALVALPRSCALRGLSEDEAWSRAPNPEP